MSPKTCPRCGIEFFDRKHPNKKHCSRACSINPLVTKRCEQCGKEFAFSGHRGKYQRFCCRQCFADHNITQVTRLCAYCGTPFTTNQASSVACCSVECAGLLRRKPENYIKHTCVQCGKPYTRHISQMVKFKTRFCCKACMFLWLSENTTGDNHPRFAGGSSRYRGENWTKQRRAALKRDGHKCVLCKRKTKQVPDVHHIVPFRLFNGDIEKANDLGNLICLCKKHHAQVENGKIPCPRPLL